MKPAKLRPLAEDDLVDVARHHPQEGGAAQGEQIFDAALAALQSNQHMPAIGSPHLGLLREIPGLRSWRFKGFLLLCPYFEAGDHLDVLRLLGDRQDIAGVLSTEG